MHDLLRIADLDTETLVSLLEGAAAIKTDPRSVRTAGSGRTAAIVFDKPSLRTRFSLEAALGRLGTTVLGSYDAATGAGSRGETVADSARVLERYADAIVVRTFDHDIVKAYAHYADVPVINALTDAHHPLQALADYQTMAEAVCAGEVRALKGTRIAYLGDGNNVAHSLIETAGLLGAGVTVCCPPGFEPDPDIVAWAGERGGRIAVSNTVDVEGVDAVYTDVWASMGQEAEADERAAAFAPFQVNEEVMAGAPDAVFLHCLPAHRGSEVTDAVMDGPSSRVFDQAENRLHTAAAVFARLWS